MDNGTGDFVGQFLQGLSAPGFIRQPSSLLNLFRQTGPTPLPFFDFQYSAARDFPVGLKIAKTPFALIGHYPPWKSGAHEWFGSVPNLGTSLKEGWGRSAGPGGLDDEPEGLSCGDFFVEIKL